MGELLVLGVLTGGIVALIVLVADLMAQVKHINQRIDAMLEVGRVEGDDE